MIPDPRPGVTSLSGARQWLRERLNEGARCPCCEQHAQVYWRAINSGMAAGAVALYRWQKTHPGEYAHLPSVLGRRSAEETKLRFWGLLEQRAGEGDRAVTWRLTEAGIRWVEGWIRVPRYVRVYDDRALGPPQPTSRTGQRKPDVHIKDALGDKFDYDALMRGEA